MISYRAAKSVPTRGPANARAAASGAGTRAASVSPRAAFWSRRIPATICSSAAFSLSSPTIAENARASAPTSPPPASGSVDVEIPLADGGRAGRELLERARDAPAERERERQRDEEGERADPEQRVPDAPERGRLLLARARHDERPERLPGGALERHGAEDAAVARERDVERADGAALPEERLDGLGLRPRGRARARPRGIPPSTPTARERAARRAFATFATNPACPFVMPCSAFARAASSGTAAARTPREAPLADRRIARRGRGPRRRPRAPFPRGSPRSRARPSSAFATHFTDAKERRFSSVTFWSLRSRRTPRSSKRNTVPASSLPGCALSTVQSWSVFWSRLPTSALRPGLVRHARELPPEALLEADLVRPDDAGQVAEALADALLGGLVRAPRPDRDRGAERREDEDRRADEELRREARAASGAAARAVEARRASARRPARS